MKTRHQHSSHNGPFHSRTRRHERGHRTRQHHRREERGFTILELVVVGAVITVLTAIGITYFSESLRMTKTVEATVTINAIERALKEYYAQHNRFPTNRAEFNPPEIIGTKTAMETDRTDGWRDINFKPDGEYRFRYEWIPEVDGDSGRVTAVTIHAEGDTDGDGISVNIFHRMTDGASGFLIEETIHPE